MNSPTLAILALALVLAGLFSFLSVFVWAHQRRREREAYYRSETLRKFSETEKAAPALLVQALQEDERLLPARRRLETCKLAADHAGRRYRDDDVHQSG